MDDKDWEILTQIDKERSISKLAADLYTTQPALTYRIKKIESFFNTKLFYRNNLGLHPTLQGELVIKHAKKMIKNLEELHESISSLDDKVTGTLHIGATRALSMYLLPDLLSKFLVKYPEIKVNIITGFSSELMRNLANNYVHIVILREDIEWSHYKKCISSEDVSIVSRASVNFKELFTLPRIDYKTNPSLKALIDDWWKKNFNEPPNIIMEVDNSETCVEMVKAGLGYAILPELPLKDKEQLKYIPLLNRRNLPIKRNSWIYCSDDAENYVAVQKFLPYLDEYYT
ncbi:LysR family transcriptional regulator [bacterium LRH843]|nr:LysR family transcriptional regulator [bacterium LRH843]